MKYHKNTLLNPICGCLLKKHDSNITYIFRNVSLKVPDPSVLAQSIFKGKITRTVMRNSTIRNSQRYSSRCESLMMLKTYYDCGWFIHVCTHLWSYWGWFIIGLTTSNKISRLETDWHDHRPHQRIDQIM